MEVVKIAKMPATRTQSKPALFIHTQGPLPRLLRKVASLRLGFSDGKSSVTCQGFSNWDLL